MSRSFFASQKRAGVNGPSVIEQPHARAARRLLALVGVGVRRLRYVFWLCYWTARHRSVDCARWVLAYDGVTW
jgi:hypothetical protein